MAVGRRLRWQPVNTWPSWTGGPEMTEPLGTLDLPRGSKVFLHQAFTCCPYAAIVTARIHTFLEANGYRICDEPADAAASVVNTCGFNGSRATQAVESIRAIRRRASRAPLVVSGCLTRIERDRLDRELDGGPRTACVGPGEDSRFDELFGAPEVPFARVRTHEYNERYSARDPRLGLFQILVATGCRNECRYCVIRHAKGDVVSLPIEDVVDQVGDALAGGRTEVFLVADDLSSYGLDLGTDLGALLEALVALDVRYSAEAFEPSRLLRQLDRVLPSLATGRFDWIVVPAQSGSDRVLRAMNRRYTRAEVEMLLERISFASPSTIVSTDLIYGFPGETDEDFEATLDLARRFRYANFNEYEARPGTPSATVDESSLRARRGAVRDFLRQQGGQLDGLTGNRASACSTWAGDGPVGGDGQPDRWSLTHADRVGDLLGLGTLLAGGWRVDGAEAVRREVRVTLTRPVDEGTLAVGLARRGADGGSMAVAGEYDVSLLAEPPGEGLSRDRSRALDDLVRRLGKGAGSPGGDGGGR